MTAAGWIFMIFSWLAIIGLVVFCLGRIFGRKRFD
jgi:hypothetical protein